MLSILIPVYNYDVRGLVLALVDQIRKSDDVVEIQLLNDGSDSEWSNHLEELSELDVVSLYNFTQNQGRVASRNKLSELANYDYLLFIDCDARVISDNFISNYLKAICRYGIIAGGHVYQDVIPQSIYMLHWKYGKQVESRSLFHRRANPNSSFSSFNFCISKDIYSNYLNNIPVSGYGHEDTFMGETLMKNGVTVVHIDNPLLHAGLKNVDQFLLDTNNALRNALFIHEIYPDISIKVIRYSKFIWRMRLSKVVLFVLGKLDKHIQSNLKSNDPSLMYLQFYKLKTCLELMPS